MVHVAFLRSVVAHATIDRTDTSAASSAPGVAAVITAAELDIGPLLPPVLTPNAVQTPRPLLADGIVRFVGEPVAMVAADTPYRAEDAAESVEVDYRALDVVATPEAALADGAPVVIGTTNVLFESAIEVGDVDGAFAEAAAVVERTFVNPRYCATPIEPRGALATPDDGGVRVWSSTQAPHKLAQVTAEILGLPREAVRVTCPSVGGGFGQKAHAYPEEILVAWLALRLGRPVKWVEDRSENLLASSHARDQTVRIRAAADADGRLLALDADVVCDTGAYGVYPARARAGGARDAGHAPRPVHARALPVAGALRGHEQVPGGRLPGRRPPGLRVRARAPDGPAGGGAGPRSGGDPPPQPRAVRAHAVHDGHEPALRQRRLRPGARARARRDRLRALRRRARGRPRRRAAARARALLLRRVHRHQLRRLHRPRDGRHRRVRRRADRARIRRQGDGVDHAAGHRPGRRPPPSRSSWPTSWVSSSTP